jgi:Protein of unknown function (DUF1838)
MVCFLATSCVAQKKLDLKNPEDALLATRKIQASTKDGENCIYYWIGSIYSRIGQERDKLLFNYYAMNIRATKTDTFKGKTGYRQVSREILIYCDPETGKIVDTWKNPWTGKDNTVVHIANDPVNSRGVMTSNMGFHESFVTIDGRVFWNVEVPLLYPNVLQGEAYKDYVGTNKKMYQAIEMFNFSVDEKELLDRKKQRADNVNISWARVCQWLPWMEMGDKDGWLVYNGQGKKVSDFEKISQPLKDYIHKNYPEFMQAPPLDDKRPNETSWTFFKKWLDKKK